MKDRLFINGQELDTNPINAIAENYQVNDLFDFSKRQTSFTNTFSVPRTAKNVNILEGLGLVGSTSNVPYQINSLTYFREGVQVFSNASAIIKETSENFKINAYFGNISFFDVIENKKLSELDLTNLDHELTISNYLSRLNGTNLIYPIADYGTQTDSVININNQSPAIKVSYLWNKIFSESGFSYEYAGRAGKNDYNIFSSPLWNNTYISLDGGFKTDIVKTPPELQLTGKNTKTYSYITSYYYDNGFKYYYVPFEIFEPIYLTNINQLIYDNVSIYTSITETKITVNKGNYYNLKVSGTILANQIQQLFFRIKVNNIPIETIEITEGIFSLAIDKRYYFESNTVISFEYYSKNEDKNSSVIFSPDITFSLLVDNQEVIVSIANYFNSISQKDFIKDLVNFFGLTYKKSGNKYQFISYKELLNPNAVYANFDASSYVADDWSEKFHSLNNEEYSVGDYGQRNYLKYKYDIETDTYADGVIQINDKTLPFENDAYERIFKAPSNSQYQVENETLKLMKLYEIEESKIKPIKTVPYIFYAQQKTGTFEYKIGESINYTYNGSYFLATFKDLNWSEQLAKDYAVFKNILTRAKKIEVSLSLNELDIKELDFFKLKFIKQLGGYFYLTKVIAFTNSEITKCEMIKVNSLPRLGEFSDDFIEDFNI